MISQQSQEMLDLACTFVPSEWEKVIEPATEHLQRVHSCTVVSHDSVCGPGNEGLQLHVRNLETYTYHAF